MTKLTTAGIMYVYEVMKNLEEKGYLIDGVDFAENKVFIQYNSSLLPDLKCVLALPVKDLGLIRES